MQRLAAIHFEKGFDIDGLFRALLAGFGHDLALSGGPVAARSLPHRPDLRLGGVVQITDGIEGGRAADARLVDIMTGATFPILEARGPLARGCRLDETGLHDAERAIEAAIVQGVDLLLVNRFGRAESEGRGLVHSLARALALDLPVLTAVREPYVGAWRAFHGGLGRELACDRTAVLAWVEALARSRPGRLIDRA